MIKRLKLLPRYIINLGLIKGLFVFVQVELLSLDKIGVPGYTHPMYLRTNTSDRQVFREVFLFSIYSFVLDKTPQTILDGGANIGLSSIYFANRFPGSTILAVEPEGSNLEALKRNVSLYPQIEIIESALWVSDTFLRIKNDSESKWAFSVEPCEPESTGAFQGLSIHTILQQHDIEKVDLLKLDIESAEKELFETNADAWLPRVSNMVVELHDWMKPGCSASFFAALGKYEISVKIFEGMIWVQNIKPH